MTLSDPSLRELRHRRRLSHVCLCNVVIYVQLFNMWVEFPDFVILHLYVIIQCLNAIVPHTVIDIQVNTSTYVSW